MPELISIVTTLYNYHHFIKDLADSVLTQSYPNWEWFIVDDCSTDDPLSVLGSYLSDKRIHYLRLKENRGYSVAKNVGIMSTKGKYIVMIDADDMLTRDSLKCRYEALKKTDKLWCHGEVKVLTNGALSTCSIDWKRKFRASLIKKGMNLQVVYHHRLIHAQSVMVRPELHKKFGLYDEDLRFSSDNEMWRRVIRFGCIPVHIEDFVAIYRVHPGRMSRSSFKKQRVAAVKRKIIERVERRFIENINSKNTRLWE